LLAINDQFSVLDPHLSIEDRDSVNICRTKYFNMLAIVVFRQMKSQGSTKFSATCSSSAVTTLSQAASQTDLQSGNTCTLKASELEN